MVKPEFRKTAVLPIFSHVSQTTDGSDGHKAESPDTGQTRTIISKSLTITSQTCKRRDNTDEKLRLGDAPDKLQPIIERWVYIGNNTKRVEEWQRSTNDDHPKSSNKELLWHSEQDETQVKWQKSQCYASPAVMNADVYASYIEMHNHATINQDVQSCKIDEA